MEIFIVMTKELNRSRPKDWEVHMSYSSKEEADMRARKLSAHPYKYDSKVVSSALMGVQ